MYLKKKSISLKVCVLIVARCPREAMPRAVREVNMSGLPGTCCCLVGGEPGNPCEDLGTEPQLLAQ